jgi:hypothetical protein
MKNQNKSVYATIYDPANRTSRDHNISSNKKMRAYMVTNYSNSPLNEDNSQRVSLHLSNQ